ALPLSMEPFSPAACVVMSNDDLLIQILLRLPATSLFWFKYVSKRWLSLITDVSFTRRRSQFSDLDPPSGLFIARPESKRQLQYEYDLVPLGIRIPDNRSAVFNFGSEASSNVEILQSCNGLLLCCGGTKPFKKSYVFNPTINVFRMLPQCKNVNSDLNICWYDMRIAFDPTKSPHYKVVCVLSSKDDAGFSSGIYWNEAIHWLVIENGWPVHFRLDIADHPKLIKIQNPGIMIDEPFDRKLLESGGCLLLFFRNSTQPQLSYVCEMRNEYSGWSVKYIVNLNDIMNPLSETWRAYYSVWGIVLGAKEEDSFIVMEVLGKVVQYKFMSKTVRTLCDIGSMRPSRGSVHQFIASFASV
ncbi:F-box protein-like protein isoform X1, partial [Tanacetum coccineum]